MPIDWSGFAFGKGQPRLVDRIQQKKALADREAICRAAVNRRDQWRCFWPGCQVKATEKHHIVSRSARGKTIWHTADILSACPAHHRYFKAGLVRVMGNPDEGPVKVILTQMGIDAKITLPKRKTP